MRSLRRTAKDVVTFIPFIIILIIPLSPVGHVLVFSFIQRFFPDFFPTPYTDRCQNLMRIYQVFMFVLVLCLSCACAQACENLQVFLCLACVFAR